MQLNEDVSPTEFEKLFNEAHLIVSKTDLSGKTTETRNSLSATVEEQSAATSEISANISPCQIFTGHDLFLASPPVVGTSANVVFLVSSMSKRKFLSTFR